MSVSQHLGIRLAEYDQRIRTFVPYYREMLDLVAGTVAVSCGKAPEIVELGIGTGALSARCLALMPRAVIHGIDSDPGILEAAKKRLARYAGRVHLTQGDFARAEIPRCDAIVATLALHHLLSLGAKRRFFHRCFAALRAGGVLVTGDIFPTEDPVRAPGELDVWRKHLEGSYGPRQTRTYLRAWSKEDRYFSVRQELGLLEETGFDADVVWRRPPFSVLLGKRRRR